jgi:hypothetical protein
LALSGQFERSGDLRWNRALRNSSVFSAPRESWVEAGDLGPFRRISLRALEKRFTGNQHLTQCDANANDLEDLFDFTNAPSMGANVAPGLAPGLSSSDLGC